MTGTAHERILSTPTLGLIWFGASVSLAEILTGTFFAPLGLEMGLAAIVVGHLIGGLLFFLVALASAKAEEPAMRVVARSFGQAGSKAFAGANVVQLVGWTAIMIMSGATAATVLVPQLGMAGWCVAIGALIVLWIAIGVKRMGQVQSVAAVLLLALTFVASAAAFGSGTPAPASSFGELSFGAAVELAAAMPLSWLPVVGDYTREAKDPGKGAAVSSLAYFIGSCWMFAIGLGCALFAGTDDIAALFGQLGWGVAGILIVVLSTVTTTFLDAQSAGISAEAIHPRLNARALGIVAALAGTALAMFAPVGNFEEFLYFIGSIFAPMATLVCVDFFVLRRNEGALPLSWRNALLWVLGFILYRASLGLDLPCGNTLPVMLAIAAAAIVLDRLLQRTSRR